MRMAKLNFLVSMVICIGACVIIGCQAMPGSISRSSPETDAFQDLTEDTTNQSDSEAATFLGKEESDMDHAGLFSLPKPDDDYYFQAYLREVPVLCDKFTNWHGYSLYELQEKSRQLVITDQTPWNQWSPDDAWVFLGYRGTDKIWAEVAASDQYYINPHGEKGLGDGLYLSSRRSTAVDYALKRSQVSPRVCYNFAPKSIMETISICALINPYMFSESVDSRQRITQPLHEVSIRYDFLQFPWQLVCPEPMIPYIKIICIEAPDDSDNYNDVPALFQIDDPYYERSSNEMQLQQVPESRMSQDPY